MADSIIGTSVPRIDGVDKVTGRAVYTGDIKFANMLCAAVARSPFPCAKIGAIDAESLRQRRGVAAVLTAEDVPPALYGPAIDDQPVLARDEARYQGEPVAVVIAASRDEAEAGAADLEVDWNPLPALTTVDEALAADAWAVHAGRAGARVPWLERQGLSSVNCCHSFVREHGDVDRALESATHVFEHEFEVPAVQAYPLERYECIALWDGSELTVWSATQSAFVVRRDLARIFGLRLNQVHVTAPLVGGGFGAKLYSKVEPIAAACAFAARGRPVKLSLSADESAATLTRHAAKVRLTTGVSADGIIVARDCLSILNNGVYDDAGPRVADKAGFRAPGPYRIGNVRSRSCTVYTNLPPNGAYRGFGAPQVVWAYETQADIIAGQLGINPLEFRERNLLHRGEYFSPDDSPLDCDIPASLAIMKQRLGQPSDDRSSPSP
jgi:CO/xanthine dehydrogenase Mo-binding subunit